MHNAVPYVTDKNGRSKDLQSRILITSQDLSVSTHVPIMHNHSLYEHSEARDASEYHTCVCTRRTTCFFSSCSLSQRGSPGRWQAWPSGTGVCWELQSEVGGVSVTRFSSFPPSLAIPFNILPELAPEIYGWGTISLTRNKWSQKQDAYYLGVKVSPGNHIQGDKWRDRRTMPPLVCSGASPMFLPSSLHFSPLHPPTHPLPLLTPSH